MSTGSDTVEQQVITMTVEWAWENAGSWRPVNFHNALSQLMKEDVDVRNWAWTTISIATDLFRNQKTIHTIEIRTPEHVRSKLNVQRIYLLLLSDEQIHVML